MHILDQFPHIIELQKQAKRRKVEVYLVGGYLRDYCLGRANQDLDFAVAHNALSLAQKFAEAIKGAYVVLDKEHGCARVVKKNKGVMVTYDFADYRALTIEDDLNHRDFTINTLAVDLQKISINSDIDNFILDIKRARKDILGKQIKRTSINALREDPLRMMRAFALRAVLDFRIDLSTLNQIRRESKLILNVSRERIRDELFKILSSNVTARTFKEMDKIKLLETIIPQLRIMYQCPQGGYHHLDVWPHSLEVVHQIEKVFKKVLCDEDIKKYLSDSVGGNRSRKALIKLGSLLHDIGKPDTRKKEGNKYSFHSHEHVGASMTRIIAKNLKLSIKESYALEDMVRWHLRPGYLSNFKDPSEKAYYRYFRDTKNEAVSIALLSWADQRSTRGPLTTQLDQKHHKDICHEIIKRYFEKQKEEPFVPLLKGNDLIKKLKLKPSPLFGKILAQIEEQQSLGKLTTKNDALALAKELVLKI